VDEHSTAVWHFLACLRLRVFPNQNSGSWCDWHS
jgi:hypothetical protein